jgi:hypothetical protein
MPRGSLIAKPFWNAPMALAGIAVMAPLRPARTRIIAGKFWESRQRFVAASRGKKVGGRTLALVRGPGTCPAARAAVPLMERRYGHGYVHVRDARSRGRREISVRIQGVEGHCFPPEIGASPEPQSNTSWEKTGIQRSCIKLSPRPRASAASRRKSASCCNGRPDFRSDWHSSASKASAGADMRARRLGVLQTGKDGDVTCRSSSCG